MDYIFFLNHQTGLTYAEKKVYYNENVSERKLLNLGEPFVRHDKSNQEIGKINILKRIFSYICYFLILITQHTPIS